jgi:flagellar basal body-associated protein FliL
VAEKKKVKNKKLLLVILVVVLLFLIVAFLLIQFGFLERFGICLPGEISQLGWDNKLHCTPPNIII